MPEGDTIFRAARTLAAALQGKAVTRFDAAYAHLRAANIDRPMVGRTVEKVHAVGKHLLMNFSGDVILRTHMRMNGSWHIYRPHERWQRPAGAMRVLVGTEDFVAVGFDIPVAQFETAASLARDEGMRRLGSDYLSPTFDVEQVVSVLRGHADDIMADAVLDQSVAAGAGNVFKCEVLFLERIHPLTRVRDVGEEGLRAVVALTQKLLRANVADGKGDGIVTNFGLRNTTSRSQASERLWVYGRGGKPCRRCGAAIEVHHLGKHARLTYLCPVCQPRRP